MTDEQVRAYIAALPPSAFNLGSGHAGLRLATCLLAARAEAADWRAHYDSVLQKNAAAAEQWAAMRDALAEARELIATLVYWHDQPYADVDESWWQAARDLVAASRVKS